MIGAMMNRIGPTLLAGILCFPILPASASETQTTRLDKSPLNTGRLSKWGVRNYQVSEIGKSKEGKTTLTPLYKWTMETQLDGPNVVLHDSWHEDGASTFIDIYCGTAGHLPVEKLAISRRVGNKLGVLGSVLIKDGKAHARIGSSIDEFAFPGDTLIHAAACRTVTLLPRTQGIRYTIPRFTDTREIKIKSSASETQWYFESVGRFRVATTQGKIICTKYELHADGRKISFYVDDQDTLQRIREGSLFIDLIRKTP